MFSYKNYKGRLSLHVESTQSCSAPSTAHQEGGHVLSLAGLANSIPPFYETHHYPLQKQPLLGILVYPQTF
jgi:hypothetical protein